MRTSLPSATFDQSKFWHAAQKPIIQAAGDGYRIWLAPINVASDDERVIVDTLGVRPGRRPVYFSDNEGMHDDATLVATFQGVELVESEGDTWVVSNDVVWRDSDLGAEARRLVDSGEFGFVSIHMGRARFAPVCESDGSFEELSDDDISFDEDTGALILPCDAPLYGAFDAQIAAVTILGVEAFVGARIEPTQVVVASAEESCKECGKLGDGQGSTWSNFPAGVVATGANRSAPAISGNVFTGTPIGVPLVFPDVALAPVTPDIQAAGILDAPPAEWFTDPGFGEDGTDERLVYDDRNGQYGCPLTVTPDGRVFGHLALWKTCHTGYRDSCVSPPRGADMSPFHQCRVTTADGATLAVGPLVVDEGHAPVAWSTDRVTRHYADTTLAAAYVVAGEDRHGIWVAGALSPRATPEMVETLKRHSLSGDWRSQGGRMGLYAAVSVNSPGFPIPQVLVAAGEPVGMITFGPAQPDREPSDMELVADAMRGLDSKIDRLAAALGVFDQANPKPCDECGDNAEPVEAAVTSTDDVESFLVEDLLAEL